MSERCPVCGKEVSNLPKLAQHITYLAQEKRFERGRHRKHAEALRRNNVQPEYIEVKKWLEGIRASFRPASELGR